VKRITVVYINKINLFVPLTSCIELKVKLALQNLPFVWLQVYNTCSREDWYWFVDSQYEVLLYLQQKWIFVNLLTGSVKECVRLRRIQHRACFTDEIA